MVKAEIEVKVLEIDRETVVKKLEVLGARKIFEGVLDGVGLKPRPKDVDLIRLRKENDKSFFTVKANAVDGDSKYSDEYEVEVGDFDEMLRLLKVLGYSVWSRRTKHRISYKLGNVRIEFDKLVGEFDDIPEFMELESDNERDLFTLLEKLDIPKEKTVTSTNSDIIAFYRNPS